MTCPVCGGKTYVHNSRSDGETVRRYRKCRECGYNFTTEEMDADLLAQRQKRLDQQQKQVAKDREALQQKLDQQQRQAAKDREAVQKKLATIKNLIEQAVNLFN